MKKIAVVGLGNILMKDDGIGVRVVQQLEKEKCLSRNVRLVKGETAGIFLLPYLEGVDAIIFVDSAVFDGACGEVRIFKEEEIEIGRVPPLSVHELGLKDIVSLIELHLSSRPQIFLVGIKPKNITEGLELSSKVRKSISVAVDLIKNEINKLSGQK